ncbi:MAG: anti-sigma factor antagonist [Cyanophyceae cyanobacterium]
MNAYLQEAEIAVVKLEGEIDANTAPKIQAEIGPLTQAKRNLMLDFTRVNYMSSSGLRLLLSLHRQALKLNVNLALVGLSSELQDTMAVVGFLDFFNTYETLDVAMAALEEKGKG